MSGARSEIRIAGAGGQGVVTAGRILAEAAILSGSHATHTQVFGPQSRGGASRSDVVIARDEIGFPLADSIDLLVVLSGEAFSRYLEDVGSGARLVVDARAVPGNSGDSTDLHIFPVVDTARGISGGQLVAGVVSLGVLQAFAGVVDADALRRAVAGRVPAKHRDMNLEALDAGMQLVNGAVA
jgi:2-oxoglutarate ferredoxin oxidoreductase subunit gamma